MFWVKLSSVREKLGAQWVGPSDLPQPIVLERRLLLGRWVGISVFAIALGLHPLGTRTMVAAYGVLALAFIYSLTLLRLIKRRHSGVLVGFVPTLVDGLLCALMLPLVGGFDSPYYAVLYAVVVSAGMRLGFARGRYPRSGGTASANACRTWRRCTPSFRAIPLIVPTPN